MRGRSTLLVCYTADSPVKTKAQLTNTDVEVWWSCRADREAGRKSHLGLIWCCERCQAQQI